MAASLNALRAVLFDLDGTLVETQIDFTAMGHAMRALAHDAQVPDAVIEGRDILGLVESAAEEVTARGGDGRVFRQAAWTQLERMEWEGCAHPSLLPGVDALLAYLQARGVKIGIVTRNCRAVSRDLVTRYALPHDALLAREDVRRAKPHPEHLWDALRVLDCPVHASAMVGDHWMDVKAGSDAGCAVTIGLRGRRTDDWFAPCPPTHIAADPGEALALFTGRT